LSAGICPSNLPEVFALLEDDRQTSFSLPLELLSNERSMPRQAFWFYRLLSGREYSA
jgi:hypothetical protein